MTERALNTICCRATRSGGRDQALCMYERFCWRVNFMDNVGDLRRSSASPGRGTAGAEWTACGVTSPSSTLAVWASLIVVLLSDTVLLVAATDVVRSPPAGLPVRVVDKLFNESTMLFGRNITCASQPDGLYVFPSETWSCYNIRVDEEMLRTCHPSGLGNDRHCNDSDAKNDIGGLCRHLLQAHVIPGQLKATLFVSDESCRSADGVQTPTRIMFSPARGDSFRWQMYDEGISGCLRTLRCMLLQ